MDIAQKKLDHKAAWDVGDFNAASAIYAEVRGYIEQRRTPPAPRHGPALAVTEVSKTVRQNGDGTLSVGTWVEVPNAAEKVFVEDIS
jgi:hypothetical protein